MQPVSRLIIGAGYTNLALHHPDRAIVVGAAEHTEITERCKAAHAS